MANAFQTSNVDTVVAPTYWRIRTEDGVYLAQATTSQVTLNDSAVAIGDVLAGSVTYTP